MFSLSICLFLCMFHYMLKMARERFTSVFFPRGVAGILFLPIFLDLYFFDVQLSISWETVILIKFYWCSWYSSDGCPAKENFLQHVPFFGRGSILWYVSPFLPVPSFHVPLLCSILAHKIFGRSSWYHSNVH